MEFSLQFVSNIILFAVCFSMGTIFLALPVIQNPGLRNYKISLKLLASAYFLLGLLSFIVLIFKIPDNGREHFTFISITISSFQALLFTTALITLLNPRFINLKYTLFHVTPFLVFVLLFIVSNLLFGNPVIAHVNEISTYIKNPTLWVRLSFFGFYIFQLLFYTWLYFNQQKKYKKRALNYFSDDAYLKLSWVRIAFLAALAIGTLAMTTYFFHKKYDGIFTLIYAVFYFGFAFEYIKYHKIFKQIEPVILPKTTEQDKPLPKPRIKTEWPVLKQQILNKQYFLESGINIEDIAQRVNIGRTTLSNLINREEGVNFNTWINTLRIEKAKQLLLENPNEPLSIIAEKVGYSEQANFSRQFRQITGYAPTLWKQKHEQL